MSQLPPQWKKEGKEGPAKTFKEKMMEKAQKRQILRPAQLKLQKRQKRKVQNKRRILMVLKVLQMKKRKERKKNKSWQRKKRTMRILYWQEEKKSKKKTDGSGKVFYYNRETKMSVWIDQMISMEKSKFL